METDSKENERYRYVSEFAQMREEIKRITNEERPDFSIGRKIVEEERLKERLHRQTQKNKK